MILTGNEIARQVLDGGIYISPFEDANLNPNSYDLALGDTILFYTDEVLDVRGENRHEKVPIPRGGMELAPGRIYLGHTSETIGSDAFVPMLHAKSTVARLGLFVHVTANLIDLGYKGQWTLQLHAVQPVRVYAGMRIAQATFWTPSGRISLYNGRYQGSIGPQASRIDR